MLALPLGLALVSFSALGGAPSGSANGSAAVGGIQFEERSWAAGRSPTLTFTTSSRRGSGPDKVAAFLYFSEVPGAFQTSPYPPQFVGILTVPSAVTVVVYPPPGRAPINEYTREKFVQGAIFDLQGNLEDVTNEEYLDIIYSAAPVEYSIDFEQEDDFTTALVNGQDVSTPPEFGTLFSVSSQQPPSGPHHHGPAIFDTDPIGPNRASPDPDLLVGLGNALMLQSNPVQTVAGIFAHPDDSANGGVIVFDFTGFGLLEKVSPRSLDLIDVDTFGAGVKVLMTDVLGHNRFYTVPAGWTEDVFANGPPGWRTLDLATTAPQPGFTSTATTTGHPDFLPDEVLRIEVTLLGSGAIDNLRFLREADDALEAAEPKTTRSRSGAPSAR